MPYAADSILTFLAIPPDPNMQGFVWIYTRAKIKTLPFATKVAWGNKVLHFAFFAQQALRQLRHRYDQQQLSQMVKEGPATPVTMAWWMNCY